VTLHELDFYKTAAIFQQWKLFVQ